MRVVTVHRVALACAGLLVGERAWAAQLPEVPIFGAKARILFQGDSITDGNRGRSADPNHILGHGYCFIVAAQYGAQFPERALTFMNRGVSGNTVSNLQARWQADTLALAPDVLSILIGINDAGRKVPLDQYEQGYDRLLSETQAALPNVKFVLCEPFYLPKGGRRNNDARDLDITQRQMIVARLAEKHHAALVRFQHVFDEACKRAPAEYWIWDSVHPTYSGHQLMAEEWVKTVSEFYR
jgi:lysophospholipase L1-like esterase